MAVTFTNHWKNILDKLKSVLRDEFKGALPVYVGDEGIEGSQFLTIAPKGSTLTSLSTNSEEREYSIELVYYFDEKIIKTKSMDHILRYTSRIEALIHDNMIMTLSDSSKALNCKIESTEFNSAAGDGIYTVAMDWSCDFVGNIG